MFIREAPPYEDPQSADGSLIVHPGRSEAGLARAIAAVDMAIKDVAALEAQWTDASLVGTPMVSTLDQARSVLTKKLGDLDTLREEQNLKGH